MTFLWIEIFCLVFNFFVAGLLKGAKNIDVMWLGEDPFWLLMVVIPPVASVYFLGWWIYAVGKWIGQEYKESRL